MLIEFCLILKYKHISNIDTHTEKTKSFKMFEVIFGLNFK